MRIFQLCVFISLLVCPLVKADSTDSLLSEQNKAGVALPDIILLMGDDHGWDEAGYNGHPHLKTPVLDEMAAAGLRMDRFYSAHPSCSLVLC